MDFQRNEYIEIQIYYKDFYGEKSKAGVYTPEELAKIYQTAVVLYDVLKTIVPASKIDKKVERYASDVAQKRDRYKPYNILPLYTFEAVQPAIMDFPEIKAAVQVICRVESLPKLRTPGDNDKPFIDMIE